MVIFGFQIITCMVVKVGSFNLGMANIVMHIPEVE